MTLKTLKSVQLPNGETLTYREREGGTEKVLLVHGNMTSSKHWDVLMEKMDPRYKIYAVDMRGFGGSTYNKRITGIKDFADDIKLFVDELGLKDFALIGWSTGGAVGMQFVADNPGYCNKLVLLASASTRGYPIHAPNPDGTPNLEKRYQTLEEIENDPGRTIPFQKAYDENDREFLKLVWNTAIYTKNQPNPEKYEEYIDDMRTQRNLADVYHALNTFNISAHHNGLVEGTNQAKDINIPVLVLRGDRDLLITPQMAEEIMEDLGDNATYVELEDCGHSPLIDDLEQLKEKIESFI
ncbi:intracellular short-chain-length polyhydroxyalkanoate depolymerase [Pallidibacillus pasinlerensis]|uniref:Alpha/beta hydrolase n=1 Tax=Pallidibacillus pasinlerensis TaxID=2703818 RepID=A0ABX0A770_9BACI|nr:alpha/beta hydrolase [Pallidibacillus pasinlerensis]NCU17290.1 alpha/beta hydrolase [Pallidibacillus pasinlerensis]